ncbi:RIBOSOME BINDING PROTEIN-1, putative [Babesia bigemina]|uniref:RIBOSOME BINDING PROTEIN-1, putative n=1 Tax=Babesia bigemina TaxID=5866 RepID=A0A061DAS6_BABBI|nr:RIBOSOME BINDING PROTEIN-1, putative [Babesia bigemina]CDR94795.1 RIBOSOME BINDING PROTEIN-1, putative [Babesia bigemina]|eukprot:XP_012766981.1 RIBOSOME BINDING PROTEIN-1, putative [Babesia bigemina]
MVDKGNIPEFRTLKECLEFLEWLHHNRGAQGQLANRLMRLLNGKYNTVDQQQIEPALSQFLTNVSKFHTKLCKNPQRSYTGERKAKNTLNALLQCIPKVLAALYFLRYNVDDGFTRVGGGDWAGETVGMIELYAARGPEFVRRMIASAGKIDRYLIAQDDVEYGVIPGGFGAGELQPGYKNGYSPASAMAGDIIKILNKETNKNNLLLDVYSTTVLSTTGSDTANIANALRLVQDFCRIFGEVRDEQDFRNHLYSRDKCINLDELKRQCKKLIVPLEKIFTKDRFSFTGYAREYQYLTKENIAKKMASWFKTHLNAVNEKLKRIDTQSGVIKKPRKDNLAAYFNKHFIPYGFTFYGYDFGKGSSQQKILTDNWVNVINELKREGDGLAKLKTILDGEGCLMEEEDDNEVEDEEAKEELEIPDEDLEDVESEDHTPFTKPDAAKPVVTKAEAAKPTATKTEAIKTEAAKPVVSQSEVTPNQGKKSEGAQNQGKKAEGAQNQGKKAEGAQNQGKKAEGAQNQGKKVDSPQSQNNGQSEEKPGSSQVAQAAQTNTSSDSRGGSESPGAHDPSSGQGPGDQAATSGASQQSGQKAQPGSGDSKTASSTAGSGPGGGGKGDHSRDPVTCDGGISATLNGQNYCQPKSHWGNRTPFVPTEITEKMWDDFKNRHHPTTMQSVPSIHTPSSSQPLHYVHGDRVVSQRQPFETRKRVRGQIGQGELPKVTGLAIDDPFFEQQRIIENEYKTVLKDNAYKWQTDRMKFYDELQERLTREAETEKEMKEEQRKVERRLEMDAKYKTAIERLTKQNLQREADAKALEKRFEEATRKTDERRRQEEAEEREKQKEEEHRTRLQQQAYYDHANSLNGKPAPDPTDFTLMQNEAINRSRAYKEAEKIEREKNLELKKALYAAQKINLPQHIPKPRSIQPPLVNLDGHASVFVNQMEGIPLSSSSKGNDNVSGLRQITFSTSSVPTTATLSGQTPHNPTESPATATLDDSIIPAFTDVTAINIKTPADPNKYYYGEFTGNVVKDHSNVTRRKELAANAFKVQRKLFEQREPQLLAVDNQIKQSVQKKEEDVENWQEARRSDFLKGIQRDIQSRVTSADGDAVFMSGNPITYQKPVLVIGQVVKNNPDTNGKRKQEAYNILRSQNFDVTGDKILIPNIPPKPLPLLPSIGIPAGKPLKEAKQIPPLPPLPYPLSVPAIASEPEGIDLTKQKRTTERTPVILPEVIPPLTGQLDVLPMENSTDFSGSTIVHTPAHIPTVYIPQDSAFETFVPSEPTGDPIADPKTKPPRKSLTPVEIEAHPGVMIDEPICQLYSPELVTKKVPSTDHSIAPPRTVREMLCWLSDLPHALGYANLINYILNLFEGSESIEAIPESISSDDVTEALSQSCSHASSVLAGIEGPVPIDLNKLHYERYGAPLMYYSEDPYTLLCQLLSYVYATYHQLSFLRTQCRRDSDQGGWRECQYGKNVKASEYWLCTKDPLDPMKLQSHGCDPSPLQGFLTDQSDISTYWYQRNDVCQKSRIKMGFLQKHFRDKHKHGFYTYNLLTGACYNNVDPLEKLCRYLVCLTRRTPRTTGELVSFSHHIGNELQGMCQGCLYLAPPSPSRMT